MLQELGMEVNKTSKNQGEILNNWNETDKSAFLQTTFDVMEGRKLQRSMRGTRHDPPPLAWTTMLGALVLLSTLVDTVHWDDGVILLTSDLGLIPKFSPGSIILGLGGITLLSIILHMVPVVWRWTIYWILVANVVCHLVYQEVFMFGSSNEQAMEIAITFYSLEAATWLVWWVIHVIYPRMVTREVDGVVLRTLCCLASSTVRSVRRDLSPSMKNYTNSALEDDNITSSGMVVRVQVKYRYRMGFALRTSTYEGNVNERGLPHGVGTWSDTSSHGEVSFGFWQDGKLSGPFRGREFSSGFGFRCMRVGYVSITDDKPSASSFVPSFEKPPVFGVASVECSNSGRFFAHLPAVTHEDIIPAPFSNSEMRPSSTLVRRCLDSMKSLSDIQVNNLETESIASFQKALIFFPGFNSSLDDSLKSFGQFLAMGSHLESIAVPFLVRYPGARVPTYWSAVSASQAPNVLGAVTQLLDGLIDAGITDFVFVSHSLGAATLVSYVEEQQNFLLNKCNVESITLLNPDFPLERFLARGTKGGDKPMMNGDSETNTSVTDTESGVVSHRKWGFESLIAVCNTITIVGDDDDQALFWSEVGNALRNRIVRVAYGEAEGWKLERQRRSCCWFADLQRQQALGKRITELKHPDGSWMDLDAIDTTFMDHNIHSIRHSYFNLNEVLLNDLHELLLTGQRAKDRSLPMHTQGNQFRYCSAPSYVVNP